MPSFATIINKAKKGDQVALESFHSIVNKELLQFASRILWRDLKSLEESKDILQEVQIRVMNSLHSISFDDRASFQRWLRVLAKNTAQDKRRFYSARKRNPLGLSTLTFTRTLDNCENNICDPHTTPFSKMCRKEEEEQIRNALSQLRQKERSIVFLHEFEGLSFIEIASRLELPSADSARKVFHRAIVKIGELIQ